MAFVLFYAVRVADESIRVVWNTQAHKAGRIQVEHIRLNGSYIYTRRVRSELWSRRARRKEGVVMNSELRGYRTFCSTQWLVRKEQAERQGEEIFAKYEENDEELKRGLEFAQQRVG